MTQTIKEDPKEYFYPLKTSELMKMYSELKPAEYKLLLYIRSIDPFGNQKLNFGVRELGKILDLNPGTISRALHKLDKLNYIDMQIERVTVTLLSKGSAGEHQADAVTRLEKAVHANSIDSQQAKLIETTVLSVDNTCDLQTTVLSVDNTCDLQTTPDIYIDRARALKDIKDLKKDYSHLEIKSESENFSIQKKRQVAKEGISAHEIELPISRATAHEIELPIKKKKIKLKPINQSEDQYSAPPRRNEQIYSMGEILQELVQPEQPVQPWGNDAGFIEYIRTNHLPNAPFYKQKQITEGNAQSWIIKRQDNEKGLAEIEALWNDYQGLNVKRERNQKQQAKLTSNPDSESMPSLTGLSEDRHKELYLAYLQEGEAFFLRNSWHEEWFMYFSTYRRTIRAKFDAEQTQS